MVKYELEVTTANLGQACTTNNVFVKLVGIEGESKRTWLTSIKGAAAFFMGMVSVHVSTLNLGSAAKHFSMQIIIGKSCSITETFFSNIQIFIYIYRFKPKDR